MPLLPTRTQDEKKAEIKEALWALAACFAFVVAGIGLMFFTPDGWYTLRVIGLLAFAGGLLGGFQALFGLGVAATVGAARSVALLTILFAIMFLCWLFGWWELPQ